MLQKSLIGFAVAFGLSAMFSLLSLMLQIGFLTSISPNNVNSISAIVNLTSAFFYLVVFASFFVVFYFLAKIGQMKVGKVIFFALFIGVLLGRVVIYQLLQFLSLLYLNIAGLLATSIFMYFMPALAGLLFVQWRENKSNNKLT